MLLDRRTLGVLLVVAAVATPALVLRAMCVGRSCQQPVLSTARAPFCSLPDEIRSRISAGFREERSPDVLAVAGSTAILGGTGQPARAPAWPTLKASDSSRVPIVFWGTGVEPSTGVSPGTGLRDVAPTLASILMFPVPHPEVRSGRAVEGVASGERPRLVLVLVWKGVGSRDLERAPGRWPELSRLVREGAGTLEGDVASMPLDPTAALATIGTGGVPAEHGIIGTILRDGQRIVRHWSRHPPVSIIATLPDDLDQMFRQRPKIGLVGTHPADRAAIGGNWYLSGDRDDIAIVPEGPDAQASVAARILRRGYGIDRVPDVLVVAMEGSIGRVDQALARVIRAARLASRSSLSVVVAGTGSTRARADGDVLAAQVRTEVERRVAAPEPVIEGVSPGGFFLDQRALADSGVTSEDVLGVMRALTGPDGGPLLADAFPGIAVTLSRYC